MFNYDREIIVEIRNYLPHREPMLMVDGVWELEEKHILTFFKIKENNIFLEDGKLSEIGVIENAAQTASGIVGWPHFEANKNNKEYTVAGYISQIRTTEIYTLPPVNAIIVTQGKLISLHQVGDIYNCRMECVTYIEEELIAECNFNLIIQP